jgi:ACS family glucarate transporter-like MFS transporter
VSISWRVTGLLGLVCFVAYLVRADVAVAQERMVPALGFSMATMGAITAWGFQLPYAVFQVPAGFFGERVGARTALALALMACSVSSLITGSLPGGDATLGTLVGTRVLLGIAQAAVFPVAAMAVVAHVPSGDRVRATSIYIALSALGAAAAPLLMAPVMERFGWRTVFLLSGGLGLVTTAVWMTLMPPGRPHRVPDTTRCRPRSSDDAWRMLRNGRLVRLSLAYLLHSAVWFVFVFWFFRYLTEGRGFTVLASGFWGSLPAVAGVVCAPLVGAGADLLGRRLGPPRARRRVAMGCLLTSASCVAVGALLPSAYLAIAALSLSSGCLNSAEAPFFTTATALESGTPGGAAGFLNLFGNLGGVLSIWLVPHMSERWGWNGTLAFWSGMCLIAALIWLTVPVEDATAPSPAVAG